MSKGEVARGISYFNARLDEICGCATLIGYSASGNERRNHHEKLRELRSKFEAELATALAQGGGSDE